MMHGGGGVQITTAQKEALFSFLIALGKPGPLGVGQLNLALEVGWLPSLSFYYSLASVSPFDLEFSHESLYQSPT